MDQDSFRRLLQGASNAGPSNPRIPILSAATASKKKPIDPSQPAFKPRTVKKSAHSKYRDRAAERREGDGNDYAEVESVLEEFEKRAAGDLSKSDMEEQRKYLGGDSEHTILVKGLDRSLLEQNKAKAAHSTADDDSLEQAFLEVSTTIPKKRTREDLVKELKEKRVKTSEEGTGNARTAEEEARILEEAKQKGKFKPIGFKPIGDIDKAKKVKRKEVDLEHKKRKVRESNATNGVIDKGGSATVKPSEPSTSLKSQLPLPFCEKHPENDNFDIFADVGEYEGLNLGDDDDDGDDSKEPNNIMEEGEVSAIPGHWIPADNISPHPPQSAEVMPSSPLPISAKAKMRSPPRDMEPGEEDQEEQPMRLQPLASSALPSIKDYLAMDNAADAYEKKKRRKEKKKGGNKDDDEAKKRNVEAKVEKDYKRLKSYTEKKNAAS